MSNATVVCLSDALTSLLKGAAELFPDTARGIANSIVVNSRQLLDSASIEAVGELWESRLVVTSSAAKARKQKGLREQLDSLRPNVDRICTLLKQEGQAQERFAQSTPDGDKSFAASQISNACTTLAFAIETTMLALVNAISLGLLRQAEQEAQAKAS